MDEVIKNTVPAKQQTNQAVICDKTELNHIKIMFLGNSMTYHEKKEIIGWYNQWGMAASKEENDYVHKLASLLEKNNIEIDKCIVNMCEWERNYKDGDEVLKSGIYKAALDFNADIIILRFLENCPLDDFDKETFEKQLLSLIKYFNPNNKAKVILTTSFWRHIGSEVIKKVAEEWGYKCVFLTDLGDEDKMKAIGKFEHSGVAMHPGDLGMEYMALRILPAVLATLKNNKNM